MMSAPWTRDQDSMLRKLYHGNQPIEEIAKVLGRSPSSINSRACKIGITRPNVCGRPWSDEQTAIARQLYCEGFPRKHIAAATGRSLIAIKRKVTEDNWARLDRNAPLPSTFDSAIEAWRHCTISTNYAVSSRGRVMSLMLGKVGTILRPWLDKYGYFHVTLRIGGKDVRQAIHRLVAFAHIGGPPTPAHQVAHNNGDCSINLIHNLRWATAQENQLDRLIHGVGLGSTKASRPLHERNSAIGELAFKRGIAVLDVDA